MELLQGIVDYMSVCESTYGAIEELTRMGFDPVELVRDFHFQQSDIDNFYGK